MANWTTDNLKEMYQAWTKGNNPDVVQKGKTQRVQTLEMELKAAQDQIKHLKQSKEVEYMRELEKRVKEANSEKLNKERLMAHLEEALKPMILRLKVLDLNSIDEEEMELVPLRFLLSELKRLVQAYDEVEKGLPVPQYQHSLYGQSMTTTAYPSSGTTWTSGVAGTAGQLGAQKLYYSNQSGNCAKCGPDQWCYCTV